MKSIKSLGIVLLAVLAFNTAWACEPNCGSSQSAAGSWGATNIEVGGYAEAIGDKTFAANFGSFMQDLQLDTGKSITLDGVYQGVSEGDGYSAAGGAAYGHANWSELYWEASSYDQNETIDSFGGQVNLGLELGAGAYGDDTLAGVAGTADWSLDMGDTMIQLGTAVNALSEGHDWSEAAASGENFALWELNFGDWVNPGH